MKKCNNLVLKEEYIQQFSDILSKLNFEDIINWCNSCYELTPKTKYVKQLLTRYKNNNNTQYFFSDLKAHLRNLKFPVSYAKIYSGQATNEDYAMWQEKHDNFNFPDTIYNDFLNHFSK